MDIQAIGSKITHSVKHAIDLTTRFAIWSGHKVQAGFTNYLLPSILRAWTWATTNFNHVRRMIETGPGATFAIAAGLFLVGIAAFKIADHKAHEENALAKTAWKVLGIATFVCATITTSLGIAAVLAV